MKKELQDLRDKMQEYGIDAYMIPTGDFHGSEYVGDYFKCRDYISGFDGSAGTLIVTADEAGLWTDGRYFIQASDQLAGSGIELKKMGQPDVPSIADYLADKLGEGQTLGYDGRVVMASAENALKQRLRGKQVRIVSDKDLVGELWTDRPPLSRRPAWPLPVIYAGRRRSNKIALIRQELRRKQADYLLLASLTDICWLLNVRGDDIAYTPVVLSYLLMDQEKVCWYVQKCVPRELTYELKDDGVEIRDYESIYDDVAALPEGSVLYYDMGTVNSRLQSRIPASVKRMVGPNPTEMPKAVKNPVEVANFRKAHIKDGVAVTRFIYWLKQNVKDGVDGKPITEISAAEYLEGLREKQARYVEPSFAPIIAYREHGAICHYSATEESNAVLKPESFVLADTGGHYLEGTTDITRTISLGPLSHKEKEMYTLVLRGHINLAAARFLKGCTGQSLDSLARTPLWDRGLDYDHGTGHGVGFLMGVHEGPNSFRYRKPAGGGRECVFEEGMVTSDEPGIYLEGEFGVRIENLIVCRQADDSGFGDFLSFDTLPMVPYDRDAILPEMLTEKERRWLNAYHSVVYDTISPHLDLEEKDWLRQETREL